MSKVAYEVVSETPATGTKDISASTQLTWDGPFWVSFIAWVSTADALAGFLGFSLLYTDPTGTEREYPIDNAVLILADATSIFSAPVRVLCRESATSGWHLERTLLGLAGNAKVSYQLELDPVGETEVTPLGF